MPPYPADNGVLLWGYRISNCTLGIFSPAPLLLSLGHRARGVVPAVVPLIEEWRIQKPL